MMLTNQTKLQILQQITFGHRIAEDEGDVLSSYFVETDQWQKIYSGNIDIVYGPKGSGKSAIYFLLLSRQQQMNEERNIALIAAENPRGTPVFSSLVSDPPTTEEQFRGLWKLYFLTLIANYIREKKISTKEARTVISFLENANLLPNMFSLGGLLKGILEYIRMITSISAVEGGVQIDQLGGVNFTGKISLNEPNSLQRKQGYLSIDTLISIANDVLKKEGIKIWILLDRLDVAFAEQDELEKNALRALFRAYLDLQSSSYISLKIFLRTDIWSRISLLGFREGSHITRSTTIEWGELALLNLIVRRILHNEVIKGSFGINADEVLADTNLQEDLFYRVFPIQIDQGTRKLKTLQWILTRVADSTHKAAPRELIHLLSTAQKTQIRKIEIGDNEPVGEILIDRSAFKEALPEVSNVRFLQTLCAEYPVLQPNLIALTGKKTQQSLQSLSLAWGVGIEEARIIATKLVDIGFFEKKGQDISPQFWVPFLYRFALNMVQGSA